MWRKFRIVGGLRTAKSAIRYMEIQRSVLGHTAENRRGVLHRMRATNSTRYRRSGTAGSWVFSAMRDGPAEVCPIQREAQR